jgi:uncharacterized protein YqjF (DUF2071 family)
MAPFLTAEWHNVVAATFAADPATLEPHLPPGVELDRLDGAARVSLVAFEFRRTRVRGLPIPGHITFPEINLRFYVRHRGERGVVFICELVPRAAVALVARALYNEPYARVPMRVATAEGGGALRVTHSFGAGFSSTLSALVEPDPQLPDEWTAEHWLTHHHLGLGRSRRGQLLVYDVQHPLWALSPVRDLAVAVDFEQVFGREWAWLADAAVTHRTFAHGSPITVSPPSRDGAS